MLTQISLGCLSIAALLSDSNSVFVENPFLLLTTGGYGLSCPMSPVPRSHTNEVVCRFDQDLRRLPYLDLAIHGAKSSLHRTTDLDICATVQAHNDASMHDFTSKRLQLEPTPLHHKVPNVPISFVDGMEKEQTLS